MGSAHRHFAVGMLLATLTLTACARAGTPVIEVQPLAPETGSTAAPTIGPLPTVGPVAPNAIVTHVVDGDTIDVRLLAGGAGSRDGSGEGSSGGVAERVRLIGIDTPESKKPDTPVECFALEAAAGTAQLLPEGTPVLLEHDVEERDRYGRLLAYVVRAGDGLFVNLELARAGYASVLTYPPNVAHTDEFVTAVTAARAAGVGLWARCESGHEPA